MCQVSGVRCQVSSVTCQVSYVTCHMSLMPTARATDPSPVEKDGRSTPKFLSICIYALLYWIQTVARGGQLGATLLYWIQTVWTRAHPPFYGARFRGANTNLPAPLSAVPLPTDNYTNNHRLDCSRCRQIITCSNYSRAETRCHTFSPVMGGQKKTRPHTTITNANFKVLYRYK